MAAKRKRAKKTAKKHTKKHTKKHAKRVKYGPVYNKALAGKGPKKRYTKKTHTTKKGKVPMKILEKRLVHLNNILKKRGGKHYA